MKARRDPIRNLALWILGCSLIANMLVGHLHAWQIKEAPLMTRWASQVTTNTPLPEYPRPQMVRAEWLNLNGIWEFQAGQFNDPVPVNQTLSGQILVPFPMESALSGIRQFHEYSWYRKAFSLPDSWKKRQVILHFGAVNWQATVYVNGQKVGQHSGGYDPVSYDITSYLIPGKAQELIVQIYNPVDAGSQPRGKQSLNSERILYTSSSGIWQTVWLEPLDASGISDLLLVPDVEKSLLRLTASTYLTNNVTIVATVMTNQTPFLCVTGAPQKEIAIPIANPRLWSPEHPFLYDLEVSVVQNGVTNDTVNSYFGLRSITVNSGNKIPQMLLNNQDYFQMGVLDQGFWPDGLYTAPSDEALRSDLERIKELGFNTVRKHLKVEPARWYYWADKLGLLVWQDMPCSNSNEGAPNPPPVNAEQFSTELTRMIQTHRNSPCIVVWTLFNQGLGQERTAGGSGQSSTAHLADLVKSIDSTRLVNEASGFFHYGAGDLYDMHSYPAPGCPRSVKQVPADGEYGSVPLQIPGHLWNPVLAQVNFPNVRTTNDIALVYDSFADDLVFYKMKAGLNAAVFTQLTDVENELNGLLTYDRVLKVDPELIRASNQKAITGKSIQYLVPDAETETRPWRYTTTAPSTNWFEANFRDSGWRNGAGGFGMEATSGTTVRTRWNTSDIWLRQTFTLSRLSPGAVSDLVFSVFHDEACEIYLNGVLAASLSGATDHYLLAACSPKAQKTINRNGTNVLAVHCQQILGGQAIDVGICRRPAAPQDLEALKTAPVAPVLMTRADNHCVLLYWKAVPGAVVYNLKRATEKEGPYQDIARVYSGARLLTYSDDKVANDLTYFYEVVAENSQGSSPPSVPAVAKPSLDTLLQTWFDADAITNQQDNVTVEVWKDLSGHQNDATQPNPSQQPFFVTKVLNGKPVVRFDAAHKQYLTCLRRIQDDFTLVCVFRSTQGLNSGLYYDGAGLVSAESNGITNDFGVGLFANGQICVGTGNTDVVINSSPDFNDGDPHVIVFRRTKQTGYLDLHVDGVYMGKNTGNNLPLASSSFMTLGVQQTLINYLAGDLAEVRLFGATLSDEDRAALEKSLMKKWGIARPH